MNTPFHKIWNTGLYLDAIGSVAAIAVIVLIFPYVAATAASALSTGPARMGASYQAPHAAAGNYVDQRPGAAGSGRLRLSVITGFKGGFIRDGPAWHREIAGAGPKSGPVSVTTANHHTVSGMLHHPCDCTMPRTCQKYRSLPDKPPDSQHVCHTQVS